MSHDCLNSYVIHKYQVVTYASKPTMGPCDPHLGLNLIKMLTKDAHKTQSNTLFIYLLTVEEIVKKKKDMNKQMQEMYSIKCV